MMLVALRLIPAVLLCLAIPEVAAMGFHAPVVFGQEVAPAGFGSEALWKSLFGTVGVTAVLVWYLYYTTAVAFPRVRQDFRDEMERERGHNDEIRRETSTKIDKICDALAETNKQLAVRPCILDKDRK
jgi:hypothetical protein